MPDGAVGRRRIVVRWLYAVVMERSAAPVAAEVRRCGLGEHAAVRALLAEPLDALYPGGRRWLDRRLSELSQAGRLTVVGPAGRPFAVALETWKPAGRVKLSTFYVAPHARRAGVGAALADAVVRRWAREGRNSVYVTVASQAAPALERVLLPRGFTPLAVELDRYGLGRDEHVLAWVGRPTD